MKKKKKIKKQRNPCGTCRICCQLDLFVVNLLPSDDPSKYDTYNKLDGIYVKKKESGSCIYLKYDGCSIYDKRPNTCKNFNCIDFINKRYDKLKEQLKNKESLNTINALRYAALDRIKRNKISIAHKFNEIINNGSKKKI